MTDEFNESSAVGHFNRYYHCGYLLLAEATVLQCMCLSALQGHAGRHISGSGRERGRDEPSKRIQSARLFC